jgi:DNA-binding beta-propeller fold protein YncE
LRLTGSDWATISYLAVGYGLLMRRSASLVFALITSVALSSESKAELVVSANDGKQIHPDDAVVQSVPDTVSILDLANGKIKIRGSIDVPASMIGPPSSVAVARDGSFAVITSSQKLVDGNLVPDDLVSVLDLSNPSIPRVSQTLHAGPGASGISISPNGNLALVASTGDDSVTIFAVSGTSLRFVSKVSVAPKSGPTDVIFSREGKTAFVVGRGNSKLMLLSVQGTAATNTGIEFSPGMSPYSAAATRDGKYVITNNLRGAIPPVPTAADVGSQQGERRPSTLSMIDINTGAIAASIETGAVPEGVVLSPNGRYLAVDSASGSPNKLSDPNFGKLFAQLQIYAIGDGTLKLIAQAAAGHWCQGMAFSKDSKTILVQCAAEKEIETFHFDGKKLVRDVSMTLPMGSRPGAIATPSSR